MDEKKVSLSAPVADLEQGSSGEAAPVSQTAEQAQGLTREDVLNILDEFSRKQQSARDKLEARVKTEFQTEFQRQIALLKENGVEVTPRVEAAIKADVIQRNTPNFDEPAGSAQAPAQVKAPDKSGDQALGAIDDIQSELDQEYGITINETDPEAKKLDFSSKRKLLKSYEDALIAKRERLQNPQGRTSGMSSGGTPGNPIASINDPDALYALGLHKH
jgi:hypothetical protein